MEKSLFKKGYTLIEMIVVIAIIGVVLPTIFTILFVIIQQQLKIYRLIEVKKQGDFVLSFMRNKIETEAVKISSKSDIITERCATTPSSYEPTTQDFYFLNKDNNVFVFRTDSDGNLVLNNFATGIPTALTTSKVAIKNLTLKCIKKSNLASPLVQISFTVEYNNSSANVSAEEVAVLNYKTKLRLKSL